jgi:DNA gyrase subunit B
MDADQLWETTLDPSRRRLRRMTLGDAEAAAEAFDMCMGDNPAPRKDFIFAEGGLLDRSRLDV